MVEAFRPQHGVAWVWNHCISGAMSGNLKCVANGFKWSQQDEYGKVVAREAEPGSRCAMCQAQTHPAPRGKPILAVGLPYSQMGPSNCLAASFSPLLDSGWLRWVRSCALGGCPPNPKGWV